MIEKQIKGEIEKFFMPRDLTFSRVRNTKHPTVEAIQIKLNQLGFSIDIDRIFGPATEDAVARFQANQKLKADGIVGPDTMAKLFGPENVS